MVRDVVVIDRDKCNGCGICVPNCHEGALQIIDGKAVLVSELMCDGLGACLGHCPEGALTIEKKEAEEYSEIRVMEEMIPKGRNTIMAHLKHLQDHKEFIFLRQGIQYLRKHSNKMEWDVEAMVDQLQKEGQPAKTIHPLVAGISNTNHSHPAGGGCPGSQSKSFVQSNTMHSHEYSSQNYRIESSELTHWPVQMHLINPKASHFQKADVLLSADCVAYAMGGFHSGWLKGKKLAIACPKLDVNKEIYVQKLISLIEESQVNTITVMIMEVPCCGGLLQLISMALQQCNRKVPVKKVMVSLQGEILQEQWV